MRSLVSESIWKWYKIRITQKHWPKLLKVPGYCPGENVLLTFVKNICTYLPMFIVFCHYVAFFFFFFKLTFSFYLGKELLKLWKVKRHSFRSPFYVPEGLGVMICFISDHEWQVTSGVILWCVDGALWAECGGEWQGALGMLLGSVQVALPPS